MRQKDKVFCEEYIIDFSPKNAALRAGFKPNTAAEAWAWIRNENPIKPECKDYINKLIAARSRRTGITADRVLQELARVAFADISGAVNLADGTVLPTASRDDTAAIASVKIRGGKKTELEVRMHDKTRALELLGRHLGMLKDSLQIEGAMPVIIDDVPESAEEEPPKPKIGFDTDG